MPHVARFVTVHAPIEAVFAFLADYRNIPVLQPHFQRVRPLSTVTYGPGATLELHGHFRGLPITAQVHIVQFEPPRLLVSDSTGAVRGRTIWRLTSMPPPNPPSPPAPLPADEGSSFSPAGPPVTRASLTLDYELVVPGLGRLLGGFVAGDVEAMTVESLKHLKRLMEGRG
jgi:Polyketide cyclase / dehydrase and lipid transport